MTKTLRRARGTGEVQLASVLDHGNPNQVLSQVKRIFCFSFPHKYFSDVVEAFTLTRHLYNGSFPGYRACTTDYHDYCHALEVFSAAARLLDGRAIAGPPPPPEAAADLLIAALLHDAGYIQESEDSVGTGAKYTRTHVDRSAAFVVRNAALFHIDANRADGIARIILGTDLGRNWRDLVFSDENEADASAILAAADILGQMGDRAYLEKLLFLYWEFREANMGGYDSAYAVLEKTLGFYEGVKRRLDVTLASTANLARLHFSRRMGIDRDLYREAIQRQMDYLKLVVVDDSVNFRKKLKRIDLESAEKQRMGAN